MLQSDTLQQKKVSRVTDNLIHFKTERGVSLLTNSWW